MDIRLQDRVCFPRSKATFCVHKTARTVSLDASESIRSLRVMTKSKRRYTEHNDRGSRGNHNARAKGSKCVQPDGASDFGVDLGLRWNQGWQRVGHGCRRSRGGSRRLEHRERVTRRRGTRRRRRNRNILKLDS